LLLISYAAGLPIPGIVTHAQLATLLNLSRQRTDQLLAAICEEIGAKRGNSAMGHSAHA
jgi:hypothetical protein